ncbi:MAM domain-containing glycosylphosphatidylinositol anchor protein 2 [Liparis tanakae]|uniref:MAM domain-containing glycosylphosphatidylinositol anchor protein 2 n=1 Tax=Liparis tanakae TaxID=230148 RepID=A0A4Z2JBJ6_9TELE|nr:MAM domain-containing glycosylphosphatidylinositol anchor protein 2 [Liparis tanakae]
MMMMMKVSVSTAPPTVRIVHSGHTCNVEEERYSEKVYTIREGETLELQCLVTGHPHPQVPGGPGPPTWGLDHWGTGTSYWGTGPLGDRDLLLGDWTTGGPGPPTRGLDHWGTGTSY